MHLTEMSLYLNERKAKFIDLSQLVNTNLSQYFKTDWMNFKIQNSILQKFLQNLISNCFKMKFWNFILLYSILIVITFNIETFINHFSYFVFSKPKIFKTISAPLFLA
jgi:hypothetical protein